MVRKLRKPEEIVAKLGRVDVLSAQSKMGAEWAQTIGATVASYATNRWTPRRLTRWLKKVLIEL